MFQVREDVDDAHKVRREQSGCNDTRRQQRGEAMSQSLEDVGMSIE